MPARRACTEAQARPGLCYTGCFVPSVRWAFCAPMPRALFFCHLLPAEKISKIPNRLQLQPLDQAPPRILHSDRATPLRIEASGDRAPAFVAGGRGREGCGAVEKGRRRMEWQKRERSDNTTQCGGRGVAARLRAYARQVAA
jgi:hypothetical protein